MFETMSTLIRTRTYRDPKTGELRSEYEILPSWKGAMAGVAAGAAVGSKVAGPLGAAVGGAIGGAVGLVFGPADG